MAEQYQKKLVNKQFNSPINLYSEKNVREIIERESRILANGAVGIDFNNPMVNKPSNLQNSAVLRMLEEEEHRKTVKRVAWPPPREGEGDEFVEQAPVQSQGGPIFSSKSASGLQGQPQSPHSQQAPQSPTFQTIASGQQPRQAAPISPVSFTSATKPWSPIQAPGSPQIKSVQPPLSAPKTGPQVYNIPIQFESNPVPQQGQQYFSSAPESQQAGPKYFSAAPQPQQTSPTYPQSQPAPPSPKIQTAPSQQFTPPAQTRQPQPRATPAQAVPQNQAPQQRPYTTPAVKQVEPPPSTITLRPQAPVSQAPPPLITSQPATATLRGGKNLRGDLKWPPENVREKMEAEKVHLQELARGPACRPTKQRKDYSAFFAKHALNSTYPGYKIPPGTQFYEHNPVW